MVDFTFCAHLECKAIECVRHHSHAPAVENASWAMLECPYEPMDSSDVYVRVVRCKDCTKNGLFTCPICFIENKTLQFVNHRPDFYCGEGERRTDG